MPLLFRPVALLQPAAHHHGVRRLHIYALRLLYALMFFMLGQTSWTHILTHHGPWQPDNAMAWAVWAACATLAGLGIIRPLQMLPLILFEIGYKVLWLLLVAYPLWQNGTLAGSEVEYQTGVFVAVLVPILLVPWRYVLRTYLYKPRLASNA